MQSSYYTNISCVGDNILFRGIKNGKRVRERIKFRPSLFVLSKKETKYKTIHDQYVDKLDFQKISEAREFASKYKDVENFPIFGNQNFEYCFIAENYPEHINWNSNDIRIANLDLEWKSEFGFADPKTANEEITAITIRIGGKVYAFGCGEFNPEGKAIYIKCSNEIELLEKFIALWMSDYPDVITGWYTKFADIPYLINRIVKVLGENEARKLSPWNYYYARETMIMGKNQQNYVIAGIAHLDYIELYRKFNPNPQENYKLDYICYVEIGEKKLSYTEYENLHTLYRDNFQKFMEYNIRDTELVEKLDAKLQLLKLAFTLAYNSKSNYDDVFTQVRMWDNIIYNHLWKKGIVIPDNKHKSKIAFEGAYVKEPILGKHKWVISFDLTSLYPHLMMQYNLSPETLVDVNTLNGHTLGEFLQQHISVETLLYKQVDTHIIQQDKITVTPNKQLFKTSKKGFMIEIIEDMFAQRQSYKKKMIEGEKLLEAYKKQQVSADKIKILENKIKECDIFQKVIKICLNSLYGSLGNEFSRFFDVRIAEAITMSGQLSIRWIIEKLNKYLNNLLKTKGKDYVIASDTDSVYIVLDKLVDMVFKNKEEHSLPETTQKIVDFLDKVCQAKIQPFIDQSYQELADYTNAYAQKMIMKREKICNVGFCISGKNYIWSVWDSEGVRYSEPKIKAVGLKMIKSNTPESARKKLKEILKLIVNDKEEELQKFVSIFREEFKKLVPEDIATPTGMKGLDEYADGKTIYRKGTAIHIKGSLLYNDYLKQKGLEKKYPLIKDGEKIKYLYLKLPNPLKNEVISFPTVMPKELGLHPYIDYDKQFEGAFMAPLKAVLDVIGWSAEEKTASLEEFFV